MKGGHNFRKILDFLPGLFIFLGYYEILTFLKVPFYFTVDRVTTIYRYQAPLLGFLELDLFVFLGLVLLLMLIFPEQRVIFYVLFTGVGGAIVFRVLNLRDITLLLIGVLSLWSGLWGMERGNRDDTVYGFIGSVLLIELLSLFSLTSYYIFGEWYDLPFNIVLKERLICAPIELVAVPAFFIASLISWYPVLFKKKVIFKDRDNKRDIRILGASLILIFIFVSLPHLPAVNPGFQPVSVDTMAYGEVFARIDSNGLRNIISERPERPLYFTLMYLVWTITGRRTVMLMDFFHPLFVFSMLAYFSFRISNRGRYGSFSPLLIPLGFTLTGYFAGGFQSNSLALIPALLALYHVPQDYRGWTILGVLLTLTGLLHSFTYLMYGAGFLGVWIIVRKKTKLPLVCLALSYLAISLIDFILDTALEVSVHTASPVVQGLGFYLFGSWFRALNFWVWNSLSNPVFTLGSVISLDPVCSVLLTLSAPLMLVLPVNLVYRIVLNLPLYVPGSRWIDRLPNLWKLLVFLLLLVRVLGNLTGLTPYIQ